MCEEAIEIRTTDGTADGFLIRPAAGSSSAGVILLTDIVGLREAPLTLAQRIADRGYVVLVPNVFYRSGRPPLWSFKPNFTEAPTLERMRELMSPLTPEAIERDAAAYVDFLATQSGVSAAPLGIVGYCATGGVALRMAAARPDRIAAVASFHGGGLYNDTPRSPHLVLPRVKARLYFGHAFQDRSMPQAAIDKLDEALAAWGGTYESEVYEGAGHGWTQTDTGVYDRTHAERAFDKLIALFAHTLK